MDQKSLDELYNSLKKLDDELKAIKDKLEKKERIEVYGFSYVIFYKLCQTSYNTALSILKNIKKTDRLSLFVRIPSIVITDLSDGVDFKNKVELENSIIWFK